MSGIGFWIVLLIIEKSTLMCFCCQNISSIFLLSIKVAKVIFKNGIVYKISYNGKSIGEVRAFEEQNVQERPNGADIFSMKLNYKNNVEWKNSGG